MFHKAFANVLRMCRYMDTGLSTRPVQADRETLEVLFLGTGAALPSKYRNVTATYLHLFAKVCKVLTACLCGFVVTLHMFQGNIHLFCSRPTGYRVEQ